MLGDWAAAKTASAPSRALALQRVSQTLVRTHRLQVEVAGQFPSGPKILVSNHFGYVDPIVLCSLVPCSPIAKAEVSTWPLLGEVAQRYNVNFISRKDPLSGAMGLWRAWQTLAAGVSVLNFPEGTTSVGSVLPFKRGVFGLSALTDVPVVPIAITCENSELAWVDEELFLPHYAKTATSGPHRVGVQVGAPRWAREFDSVEQFTESTRRWIAKQTNSELAFNGH